MSPTRGQVRTVYGVLSLTDTLLAAGLGPPRVRRLTKPMLMPTLAMRLVIEPSTPGRDMALAAQALSWGGDVALMREDRRTFLLGVGLFLAAHGGYVSAFRRRSSTALTGSSGRRRALGAGFVAALAMAGAASRQDPTLGPPVAAYGMTLATMVTAAAAVDTERGRAWVLTGASLFLVSDGLLGVGRFVVRRHVPVLDGAVMATYTAAQWCIGEGIALR